MRLATILILSLIMLFTGPAKATERAWYSWLLTPPKTDFERPYLQDGKTPHYSQWERDDWTPDDWTKSRGSKKAVLAGLEQAGIIRDMDGGDTTLRVGRKFLRLSDQEKIHVVKYVDDVYGVTKSGRGMMRIELDNGCLFFPGTPVGVYTKHGLQLQ
jgi:hypothetical protein